MSPIAASRKPFILIRLLDQWGDLWVRTFTLIGGVSYVIYDVLIWVLRGLFMKSWDEVKYEKREGGGMRLTMVKLLPTKENCGSVSAANTSQG